MLFRLSAFLTTTSSTSIRDDAATAPRRVGPARYRRHSYSPSSLSHATAPRPRSAPQVGLAGAALRRWSCAVSARIFANARAEREPCNNFLVVGVQISTKASDRDISKFSKVGPILHLPLTRSGSHDVANHDVSKAGSVQSFPSPRSGSWPWYKGAPSGRVSVHDAHRV